MNILALDPGTKCGWADSNGGSGVWDLLPVTPDDPTGRDQLRVANYVTDIVGHHRRTEDRREGSCGDCGIDRIVYEASRNLLHGNAVRVAGQLEGVLLLAGFKHDIEIVAYSPKQVKKHACGKGNATKLDLFKKAIKKWPDLDIIDDNHADALWLLNLAMKDHAEAEAVA